MIWGSVAAIAMRVLLTLFAVQLLQLPWLKAAGAVLLAAADGVHLARPLSAPGPGVVGPP